MILLLRHWSSHICNNCQTKSNQNDHLLTHQFSPKAVINTHPFCNHLTFRPPLSSTKKRTSPTFSIYLLHRDTKLNFGHAAASFTLSWLHPHIDRRSPLPKRHQFHLWEAGLLLTLALLSSTLRSINEQFRVLFPFISEVSLPLGATKYPVPRHFGLGTNHG